MQKGVMSIHRGILCQLMVKHTHTHTHMVRSSVLKSVVLNKDPDPVEWHIAGNREEYNILTVS